MDDDLNVLDVELVVVGIGEIVGFMCVWSDNLGDNLLFVLLGLVPHIESLDNLSKNGILFWKNNRGFK